ncbi:NAD(P)-dependent oxidoreductase [Reichenbachiella carrageenanivorans]|uniref:NAD(P)-dependent oxidoreductase n=1 Tax=Reichenbachiella carrageenanivorans TaxID=2979869 RepID=A0ABY6D358_9BACT|nr:NAD(P)-dependent oxidoreductase [Reichenbachiella carrageenanivorans]UXX80591.1 NAD(P)-dependent oxidoreductase [Reichenbachiella carrageenanivorans]
MKILITGGSGFIGTHLIQLLLSSFKGISITNLDLLPSKIDDKRIETLQIDIRSNNLFSFFEEKSFDICIHLAALCKEPGFEWEEYFATNHTGTKNIITLCENLCISKIIFTSTMMVHQAGEVRRTEESVTAPDTAYGISKLLAEKELEKWRSSKPERSLKIIRPAVVFGENENANFTRLFLTLKKGFFPYVGKSSTIKSNIYVHELNRFIHFLIEHKTKLDIYNFSFPSATSMRNIVSDFKVVFKMRVLTVTLPYKLMLFVAYMFEFLNSIGLRNSIHHRRIQKLYYSTYIHPANALAEGYEFKYTLKSALEDWNKYIS